MSLEGARQAEFAKLSPTMRSVTYTGTNFLRQNAMVCPTVFGVDGRMSGEIQVRTTFLSFCWFMISTFTHQMDVDKRVPFWLNVP